MDENKLSTMDDVLHEISNAENTDQLKSLTDKFNQMLIKRTAFRTEKMDKLLDLVTDNMEKRIRATPDNFSNSDLLDYFDAIQKSIDRNQKQVATLDDAPRIQLNQQNNIVIESPEKMSAASTTKILNIVRDAMTQMNNQIDDEEEGDKEDDD